MTVFYIDIDFCFGEPHQFSSVCNIVCFIVYNLVDHFYFVYPVQHFGRLWLFLNVIYIYIFTFIL